MMKIEFVDRHGVGSTCWLDSDQKLVDEYGCLAYDYVDHPFYPQPRSVPKPGEPDVKTFLDALMMVPPPPMISGWVGNPDYQTYPRFFGALRDALFAMTGKVMIGITRD